MKKEDYKKIQPYVPHQPGVYRFLDEEDKILYIGKAKSLKNRLNSYFASVKAQAYKTKVMIHKAVNIKYTVVESENDALLLESTLIKKHQPKYNIMLKDGKTYTYLCIVNERFPRVFLTRRVIKNGSTYFGPYTSKYRIHTILGIIKEIFPLRTCNFNLSKKNIDSGKFKICLEYHIHNCKGACVGEESEEEYNEKISQIKNILKGNFGSVKEYLRNEIGVLAEKLEFEKAQVLKEKLSVFENYQGKSTIVSTTITNVDVFNIQKDEKSAFVNYLKVVNGALINAYTQEITQNLNEDMRDILIYTIPILREKFQSIATEWVIPFEIPQLEEGITHTIPKIGDKKKLLELSDKNITYFILQKRKEVLKSIRKQTSQERILKTLQSDLHMENLPFHIECFDNSNLGGSYPTASCVVFKNAKPSKKDYRHFHIKTVIGPDDFASMKEVVGRRYARLIKEEKSLPQLIVIDGGKGQLSHAVEALEELGIHGKITIIGIAKRLEEIFFPGDSVPIYINKKSEALKLIQHLRNEAHRFAITFHRNLRSKDFTTTELTKIVGIGEKTAEKLLSHYGSVKKIKAAKLEDIEKEFGKSIAGKLKDLIT